MRHLECGFRTLKLMETFLAITGMLLFFATAGIAVFFLTIHPIWAIIDVAASRDKTTGEKTLWIVMMFILWSLVSLLYGLVFATRPLAVTTRVLVADLLVLILVLLTLAIVVPMTVDPLRDSIRSRV